MDFATIQAQLAKLTSQLSQYLEMTTMQSVPTYGVSYGQGYPTHQCSQFTANEDAWGYQGHSQSWDNMFSNAYNPDWRDYSDYMWGEPQQFQQDGYWQQEDEFYSRPMQPPQPLPQQFQSNSSMPISYDEILDVLTSLTQGSQEEEYLRHRMSSITGHMNHHSHHNNLPNSIQVHLWIMICLISYSPL
ncbi:hypothetical protein ACFX16_013684 [Malus domestica]